MNRIPALSPSKLARAFFMKPLAFLLALLLMPKVPVLRSVSLTPSASAVTICSPGRDNILQNPCHPTFETDGVIEYLTLHQIPTSDAPLVYQYGRTDLRSEIRAYLFTRLLTVIKKPASERTSSEQFMYDWLLGRVWDAEKAYYQSAYDDGRSFQNNLCAWQPDPDVAKQYGLKYNSAPFCDSLTLHSLFYFPPVPTLSYFLAAALKRTYGDKLGKDPNGAKVLAETNARLAMIPGIAAGAAALGATVTGVVFSAGAVLSAFFPMSVGMVPVTSGFAFGTLAAGPLAIILIAVLCGVMAGFQAFDTDKNAQDLKQLDSLNQHAKSNPPDLATMAQDQQGLLKLTTAFVEASIPEFESTAALPAHRSTDARFVVSSQDQQSLTYQDWEGRTWSASTYGGWFVQTCVSASCSLTSFSPSLRYVDWDGIKRVASRLGGRFSVTLGQDKDGAQDCPGDAVTGLTAPGSETNCKVFATETLRLKDGNGTNVSVRLNQLPRFTSPDNVAFTAGVPRSFQITTDSIPTATVSYFAFVLPAGFSLHGSAGSATLTYDGTAPTQQFSFGFAATSTSGSVSQTLFIVVGSAPSIRWQGKPNLTFPKGQLATYRITTTGSPTPVLTAEGLTGDYTFVDNHDGTGTLSAKLPVGTIGGFRFPEPCNSPLGAVGIRAKNAVSDVFEPLCIQTTDPSPITFQTPASTSFNPGVSNSYVIGATGGGLPIRILVCDAPSWMSISEANGATTISGRPSAFDHSTVNLRLWANYDTGPLTCGSDFVSGFLGTKQNLAINLNKVAAFSTGNTAMFEVGKSGSFVAKSNVLNLHPVGELPKGLSSFSSGSGEGGTLTLSGTPEAATGGVYQFGIDATEGALHAAQDIQVVVTEPGRFVALPVSPSAGYGAITLVRGTPVDYQLTTSGFPKMPSFGLPGLSITRVGPVPLPPGVSLTQIVENGRPTGEWKLTGTPTTPTVYPVTLEVKNGVGSTQSAQVMIRVIRPGDLNGSGAAECADATLVRSTLGKRLGQQGYDPFADANNDGVIDVRDLAAVSSNLPAGTRCN